MYDRPKRKGVMLAVPADEGKVSRLGEWFYIQPKLNGERGRVMEFQGRPLFLSSYENPFYFIKHLEDEIQYLWDKYEYSALFDGEIYVHGWTRERIDSALRRTVNKSFESQNLEFHVFDLIEPIPQGERIALYQEMLNDPKLRYVKPVATYKADATNWYTFADFFLEQGYEGAMLRRWDYPVYEARRLVGQMLKYKPTEIDIYKIVDISEAIAKDGTPKGMIGSFLVVGDDNEPFSVGAGKISHPDRIAYWEIKQDLIGKRLRVKQGKILTTSGIPTCAVAVDIEIHGEFKGGNDGEPNIPR